MTTIKGHISSVTVGTGDLVNLCIEAHEQPIVTAQEWDGLGVPALVLYWTGYYCTVYREAKGGALYLFKGVIKDETIEAQTPDPFLGEDAVTVLQRVGVIYGRYRKDEDAALGAEADDQVQARKEELTEYAKRHLPEHMALSGQAKPCQRE